MTPRKTRYDVVATNVHLDAMYGMTYLLSLAREQANEGMRHTEEGIVYSTACDSLLHTFGMISKLNREPRFNASAASIYVSPHDWANLRNKQLLIHSGVGGGEGTGI